MHFNACKTARNPWRDEECLNSGHFAEWPTVVVGRLTTSPRLQPAVHLGFEVFEESWFRGQKSRQQLARRAPQPQLNTFPRRKPVQLFFTLIHSYQGTDKMPLERTPIFSVCFSLVVWRVLWIHWEKDGLAKFLYQHSLRCSTLVKSHLHFSFISRHLMLCLSECLFALCFTLKISYGWNRVQPDCGIASIKSGHSLFCQTNGTNGELTTSTIKWCTFSNWCCIAPLVCALKDRGQVREPRAFKCMCGANYNFCKYR